MTSLESARRFQAMYHGRGAHLHAAGKQAWLEFRAFRDFVCEHITRLSPRRANEIYERVVADYGHVRQRRVERALSRLWVEKRIVRTADGYVLSAAEWQRRRAL